MLKAIKNWYFDIWFRLYLKRLEKEENRKLKALQELELIKIISRLRYDMHKEWQKGV